MAADTRSCVNGYLRGLPKVLNILKDTFEKGEPGFMEAFFFIKPSTDNQTISNFRVPHSYLDNRTQDT